MLSESDERVEASILKVSASLKQSWRVVEVGVGDMIRVSVKTSRALSMSERLVKYSLDFVR